ncbi:MAG: GNAT family N-acetyltransferase [Chloroflexi bacterium]|nr:GNAT family N-acetyltransferase [Chloroflexota bacterium]MDA1271845.1 GNAT family N-acetyltransferase [Chloroflexota bacterium]
MMRGLPNAESYPKDIVLRDGDKVSVRPLNPDDKVRLLEFFERIPEEERYYLKENVASAKVIQGWTANLDLAKVIPIVAVAGDAIVADATLHLNRTPARSHLGEVRVVVDPAYREVGLGGRLIREILDIAASLGLTKVVFELVAQREKEAVCAAERVGFKEVATLENRIKDFWGNYQDLILLEIPVADRQRWWKT